MAEPGWATQKAIYAALTAGSPAPGFGVYDAVPAGAAYPYVVISSQQAVPDDPLASRRDERWIYLSVWSTHQGQQEVLEIMAEIDTRLHQQRLALETGRMVRAYVTRKLTLAEPDGATWQGQVTVKVIAEH